MYVLHHAAYAAVKIGISSGNNLHTRLEQHTRHGWSTQYRQSFADKSDAAAVERAVLHTLRVERGIPAILGPDRMPQGGWSETASTRQITSAELVKLVEQTASAEVTA